MSQAILNNHLHSTGRNRQWVLVGLLSLLLHSTLVLWFSSRRPDFPDVEFSEFKVGLISSEGMGETLEASRPEIAAVSHVATEDAGIVTQQEIVSEVVSKQTLKVSEQFPPDVQALTENIELAAVVAPETSSVPDVSPPAISDIQDVTENKIEEAQPVESIEISTPSATSVDAEVIETVGISSDMTEVDPINDFFKPAEVLTADDPMTALPIEQLAAVPAPEAIMPDDNPELASDDVEILEIQARELVIQREPVPQHDRQVSGNPTTQTGTGDDPLHPKQSPLGTLGEAFETTKQVVVQAKNPIEPAPLVIPKTYILELKSWLSQYKKYPQQAHRLKQEGVVIVGLVIDRSGKIISHEIRRSSGHKLLDQEVELMIQRAAKMPALPADFPRDSLELLIPIRFKVKT